MAFLRHGDQIVDVINQIRRFVPFPDMMHDWPLAFVQLPDAEQPDIEAEVPGDDILTAPAPEPASI